MSQRLSPTHTCGEVVSAVSISEIKVNYHLHTPGFYNEREAFVSLDITQPCLLM